MFKNQPKGLYVLALANTGERFGYYTTIAVFLLYLQAKFGMSSATSGQIYAIFMACVYFMPVVGGWLADRWSFNKCVVTGIFVMFAGYLLLSIPSQIRSTTAIVMLAGALLLIAVGTGLFKGNLQVMVGDLYNNPQYSDRRDAAFSLFYMAINIGSMFAPMAATAMCNLSMHGAGLEYAATLPGLCNDVISAVDKGLTPDTAQLTAVAAANGMTVGADALGFATRYLTALTDGYGYAFGVGCLSLVVSFMIYYFGRQTYASVVKDKRRPEAAAEAAAVAAKEPELTPKQTRQRIVALLLVFAVVIFFWMVFQQNGATLTEFAKSCTSPLATGWTRVGFNVWALAVVAVAVYALFGAVQAVTTKGRAICGALLAGCIGLLVWFYLDTPDPVTGIQPQEYQQFNPFFVVALTPVSLAIFAWLARRKKEPSAPRKIGYGMITAAAAYGVLMVGSFTIVGVNGDVSPNWLMGTYLMLTFAELLLSPMGISFVSKVAPPKYKGAMMGGWFAATAVGNYLVSIPMLLWGKIPVWSLWAILAGLCLVSGIFIFSIMRKLEAATEDAA